jgi:hypothetical protein
MTGIIIVALLNVAFGVWVARLIAKDPANLRKFRERPKPPTDPDEPPAS